MADTAVRRRPTQRQYAGLMSSAATFSLPMGEHFEGQELRGYYIDMRTKARTPTWDGPEECLYVVRIQWGLGCFERYVANEGEQWLAGAVSCAEELLRRQHAGGAQDGGFLHHEPLAHTFGLRPPWISAMAQGEAASLLLRVARETGQERFAQAAERALLPLGRDSAEGGVRALLDGEPFPEEYPTQPPSFVLNGGIFAIWGVHDVAVALAQQQGRDRFERLLDTLAANIHRWDTGYWSRYDLFPHPIANLASSFYHDLHINQLRAMQRLAPRPQLAETAERWAGYASSRRSRTHATARKVLYRLLVPRNSALASRLPWSHLRSA